MSRCLRYGFVCFVAGTLVVSLAGCETLKKKFTRKRKSAVFQEPMVIVPRDYSAHPFPSDVLYKQYFLYWKSWQQELVSCLNDRAPYKKILDCAEQSVLNLRKMSGYLVDEKAEELKVYIAQAEALKAEIAEAKNLPDARMGDLRYRAERILSRIGRKFDAAKTKDFLK